MGRKTLHLKNEQGRGLTITLREYRPGDEEGMIACIRDEYGDTYFKRGFYEPSYIKEESDSGHITFLVAQTKAGEIAGMLILKEFSPKEDMCEIASQIFRKKYRGYGLAMPFFEYAMDILLNRNYSAAYCLPVLFHDVTQRLLYRLGMHATGFILNVFDIEHITHSYHNGKNTKHSQGIQIRPAGKRDAGMIYLPREHREFCMRIYSGLGVKFNIEQENTNNTDELLQNSMDIKYDLPPVTLLHFRQDELQQSLEISIYLVGEDLVMRIDELHKKHPLKGRQTACIFLNCNDKNAVWAYRMLEKAGYFFTGLKPLCSKKEYMVLHNPGEMEIYFEDYVVSEEFKRLLNYVAKEYKNFKARKADGSLQTEKEGGIK
ncbi:MAG: GNAT family N-acetyltransferase [Lachnospiraceae bacterium]|nr:GNAT family N-acetyltransferase [Lachnospiraceae bacterium]